MKEFLDAVGHLKFRGTSLLFRLPASLNETVAKKTKENPHLAKKRFMLMSLMLLTRGQTWTRVNSHAAWVAVVLDAFPTQSCILLK